MDIIKMLYLIYYFKPNSEVNVLKRSHKIKLSNKFSCEGIEPSRRKWDKGVP